MNQHQQVVEQRMSEFRRKYYVDKIVRGSLILALLMSSMLFIALLSEGMFGFSSAIRTGMVTALGLTFLGVLAVNVLWPVSQLMNVAPNLSNFQIAHMVRRYFPDINDKLVNFLQLQQTVESNALAAAAMEQKAAEIAPVRLSNAINLNLNRRYLWFLLIPIGLLGITWISNPALLSTSSHRLVNYNQEFVPPPPFEISLSEVPTELVAGQDYTLNVKVDGDALPQDLYVFVKNDAEQAGQFLDFSMIKEAPNAFSYTLEGIKEDFSFFIGNPEVKSSVFPVTVLKRPFIRSFQATVSYPAYTGLAPERLEPNVGDLKVLKGSTVRWELFTQGDVKTATLVDKKKDKETSFAMSEDGSYSMSRRLMEDLDYFINLTSPDEIANIDTVTYRASVLQDRFPSVYVYSPNNDFLVDLDPNMPLDLEVADDFGFTRLGLFYRFTKSGGTSDVQTEFKEYTLGMDPRTLLQSIRTNIDLTALGLKEGDELEYYIKVWDNDGVSGPKAATSATYKVVYPTLDAKYDDISGQQEDVKEDLETLKETSESLKEAYEKMKEKMLEQRKLSFDDKKEMQRMVEEHKQMLEKLEQAQEQFEEAKDKLEENQMISEQTLEKFEELNKFMEELNNPEVEKMLEEMMEQMEEMSQEELNERMEQLQMNDEDLQKSIERTLELIKQLEVQQKMDELRNKLDNLAAKQEMLEEKLDQAETSEEMESVGDRQEDLNEQLEDVQKDLEKLSEMKESTQTPDGEKMDELQEQGEEASEEMEKASEEMKDAAEQQESGKKKDQKGAQESKQSAGQSQKNAKEKMEEMSEQLSNMQMSMQQQQDQENLDDLRTLLENLLKLSFDQEDLRNEVDDLQRGDPALKDKSQQQKKLQDDMGLIQDSLDALASRAFQIQKFVLDESQKIESNMKKSQTFFRNKQIPMISYHQQSAMTSVNNLANMLSDVMKQIQEQMMNSQAGQGMCVKPQGAQPKDMQGLSKQQQKLNEQMQQMMKAGKKPGDKMSEMAAQQKAIRKQLEEAAEKMRQTGEKGLGDLDKIAQDMKETEADLINKQLTQETLLRQQQIISRLLQSDRAMRERDEDDKRESKTAMVPEKKSPEELSLEEYKNKIRQELLKSNKLEYSNDFIILIEQYFNKLERSNE